MGDDKNIDKQIRDQKMITKYFNQLALATVGTGMITLGVITGAEAATFNGGIEISGLGFYQTLEGASIENSTILYTGTEDFQSWSGVSVGTDDFSDVSEDNPYESFFTFSDGEEDYAFTLTNLEAEDTNGNFITYSITEYIESEGELAIFTDLGVEDTNGDSITYSITGYIEDEGDITALGGVFTAQHGDNSSWSVSLETVDIEKAPETSTILGLIGIATLGMTGLRRKG